VIGINRLSRDPPQSRACTASSSRPALRERVTGAAVTALRRQNVRTLTPPVRIRVEEGGVPVFLGSADDLAAAKIGLLQG
jgi:hypothetical protein